MTWPQKNPVPFGTLHPLVPDTTHISYFEENSVTVEICNQPCKGLDFFELYTGSLLGRALIFVVLVIGSKNHVERLEEIASMTSTPINTSHRMHGILLLFKAAFRRLQYRPCILEGVIRPLTKRVWNERGTLECN